MLEHCPVCDCAYGGEAEDTGGDAVSWQVKIRPERCQRDAQAPGKSNYVHGLSACT